MAVRGNKADHIIMNRVNHEYVYFAIRNELLGYPILF